MYVRHTPRYTGFGLGADVPVVTLSSVMPPAPQTAGFNFALPTGNTALIFGAGLLALLIFTGGWKAQAAYAPVRKKRRSARAAKLRAEAKRLEQD